MFSIPPCGVFMQNLSNSKFKQALDPEREGGGGCVTVPLVRHPPKCSFDVVLQFAQIPVLQSLLSNSRRTGAPGENSSGSRQAIPDEVLAGFEPRSSDSLAFALTTRPPRPG